MTVKVYSKNNAFEIKSVFELLLTPVGNIFIQYWNNNGELTSRTIENGLFTHFEVIDRNEDPANELFKL